jgi:hypothetical protein
MLRASQHNPGKVEKHMARNIHIAKSIEWMELFCWLPQKYAQELLKLM